MLSSHALLLYVFDREEEVNRTKVERHYSEKSAKARDKNQCKFDSCTQNEIRKASLKIV